METMPGRLFVVATPLGNLEDISLRAIKTLRSVAVIAAEDTRRTGLLCRKYKIRTKQSSYYDYNEKKKTKLLLRMLQEGQDVALVSDAGTPGISDPGYPLIIAAIKENIPVIPIPGPSALTAALPLSGMSINRFYFVGYLPRKKEGRKKELQSLSSLKDTIVLFEAPHRLKAFLDDALAILGNRNICLFREMTKIYEEIIRGTISEVLELQRQKRIRGELTLVVEGCKETSPYAGLTDDELAHLLREEMDFQKISLQDALKILARRYGVSKSTLYRRIHRGKSPGRSDSSD